MDAMKPLKRIKRACWTVGARVRWTAYRHARRSMQVFRELKKNGLFFLSRRTDFPLVPPDMVQVNFTFECNLRCKMCSMHQQKEFLRNQGRQVEIDSETLRKIIAETRQLGTDTILFIGGEPLLRRDIFDLVAYAKEYDLATVIVTNGVLLDENRIRSCFTSGVDWLSISIDGASDGVFRQIRGEKMFEKIGENIRLLNRLKAEEKRAFPKTVAVCTIMNENIEELPAIVKLCRELAFERIIFQPVVAKNIDQTQRGDNFSGAILSDRLSVARDAIDELIAYKKQDPRQFSFIANSIRYLELIKKSFAEDVAEEAYPCYAGFNRVQVVQEGKLYFCVSQENQEATFGDVTKHTLKELWYSSQAKEYRKMIKNCKVPCLQWCSYREGFIELEDFFVRRKLFGSKQLGK